MNIKKNKIGFKGITDPTYITIQWSRISGYKTRGYKNRVSRVAKSRTIRDNLDITQHVKRNRVYHLVKPTIK